MSSILIKAQQVVINQPPARVIRPGIAMENPDFMKGFNDAMRSPDADEPLSDEEIVDIVLAIAQGPEGETAETNYSVGNLIGSIIASCQ